MRFILEAIHEGLFPLVLFVLVAAPIASRLTHETKWLRPFSIWVGAAGCAIYAVGAIVSRGRLSAWFLVGSYLIAVLVAIVSGQLAASFAAVFSVLFAAPVRCAAAAIRSRIEQQREQRKEALHQREQRRIARLNGVQESLRWRAESRRRQEEALQEVHQEALRVEAEAARRELDSHRDHLRYDLRFAFESLKLEVQTLLTEQVFADLLRHALSPADTDEIDRRCGRLKGLLEALQPPPDLGLGDLEKVALAYEERRGKLAEMELPERTKDKLIRWLNREEAQRIHQIITEDTV